MANTAEHTAHRARSRPRTTTAVAAVVSVVVVVGGCGGSEGAASNRTGGAVVESPWARATAAGQTTGAIYFDVSVDADDVLLDVSVPASVAADTELHEAVIADVTGGTGHDMADMETGDMTGGSGDAMAMQPLASGVQLAGGRTLSFEPGSYHVMLVDLVEPLVVGDIIPLVLDFQEAPDVTIDADVRESAP